MNITDEERRVIILHRLTRARDSIIAASEPYMRLIGGTSEHERERHKLRVKLAEIADGLGKACD